MGFVHVILNFKLSNDLEQKATIYLCNEINHEVKQRIRFTAGMLQFHRKLVKHRNLKPQSYDHKLLKN